MYRRKLQKIQSSVDSKLPSNNIPSAPRGIRGELNTMSTASSILYSGLFCELGETVHECRRLAAGAGIIGGKAVAAEAGSCFCAMIFLPKNVAAA